MKITAPISRVEEIEILAAAGADEFYCSVVPESWTSTFKTSAVSRRALATLAEYNGLEEAVTEAPRVGTE